MGDEKEVREYLGEVVRFMLRGEGEGEKGGITQGRVKVAGLLGNRKVVMVRMGKEERRKDGRRRVDKEEKQEAILYLRCEANTDSKPAVPSTISSNSQPQP